MKNAFITKLDNRPTTTPAICHNLLLVIFMSDSIESNLRKFSFHFCSHTLSCRSKELATCSTEGRLANGFLLAIFMANAGGAWDNAKKYIEDGNHGGKGSDAHKAAVTGDTVGDPFKDTSGPSLNILIKLSAILSRVFVPFFILYDNFEYPT